MSGPESPPRQCVTVDGNEAAASVAYRTNEVISIYPITPASPMGELSDEWSAKGRRNIWGSVPTVVELQSEAGAAGAVHGALQGGALSTTFTASQGLLLMVPNMYKIAGELTSYCMHVAARSLATHALSIFCDHSDVMACRQTGFSLLCSGSVQEAHDFAAIGQAATLRGRIPVMHFFDGFRTSHEVAKIEQLSDDQLRRMIPHALVADHRARALTPDKPVLRGTAQNPDVFFQAREACNPFYDAFPAVVEETMGQFAALTSRRYQLFDYVGHPEARRIIIMMGSGSETAHETVEALAAAGDPVGLVKVRLYRPFSAQHLLRAIPRSASAIAVLDRTKEPGAPAEPLYLDVLAALEEDDRTLTLANGRYGLSSKEFTPAMVKATFDELAKTTPKRRFTVGINDDVSHSSIDFDPAYGEEPEDVLRAVFFGLGSDGTVGANKNTIKILGKTTESHVQGFFVYDSKKSGAITISHLRVSPRPIRSTHLIRKAQIVACHQLPLLERYDVVGYANEGATLLLNSPHDAEKTWDLLPLEVQEQIIERKLRVVTVDAYRVAREAGVGGRINTIMQTVFFAVAELLPTEQAISEIKQAVRDTYGRKGEGLVARNFAAIDAALAHMSELPSLRKANAKKRRPPPVPPHAPDFVQRVTAVMLAGNGDLLPVSAFPVDGSWPTGTSKWEKRAVAQEIPLWDASLCIQCNKCAFVCPHAAIRAKVFDPQKLSDAPEGFESLDYKAAEFKGLKYNIQVAPEDCTGCGLCVVVCPAKDKAQPKRKSINLAPVAPVLSAEREKYEFFLGLPEPDRSKVPTDVKGLNLLEPLFEYSGACAGCGETPYIQLLTRMFGDRMLVANATGCSSIYGGNLPTTPYSTNRDGRGPAWSNSLFEDNAEFGLGLRLAVDQNRQIASELLASKGPDVGVELVTEILNAEQQSESGMAEQRDRIDELRRRLKGDSSQEATTLAEMADSLIRKTVWIIGGDGWAYDIGYGGLDHVLSMGRDVNIIVLDTEVYSNTGGQQSKATPRGAAAKFAVAGKESAKKDLALMAMAYGNVYVAQIAFGAKDLQTVRAVQEADSYRGTSLIIAYSHCIAHGYDLHYGLDQQKLAVDSGQWPLFRFDPRRATEGQPPLHMDVKAPKKSIAEYMRNEARFRIVERSDPARFKRLLAAAQRDAAARLESYHRFGAAPEQK